MSDGEYSDVSMVGKDAEDQDDDVAIEIEDEDPIVVSEEEIRPKKPAKIRKERKSLRQQRAEKN